MKISIVTINRNDATGLEKTIRSVVAQDYNNIEYLVIDGASTDNSVDIIRKYETRLALWISEPDKGIYDAMNKGSRKATGDYCLYLNSGDTLVNNHIISYVAKKITASPDTDIFSCDMLYTLKGNTLKKIASPNSVTFDWYINSALLHPVTFIRTSLVKKHPYKTDYKIVSDWIFFFEALFYEKATYQHIHKNCTLFDMNGISTLQDDKRQIELKKYLQSVLPDFAIEALTYKNNIDEKFRNSKISMPSSLYGIQRAIFVLLKGIDKCLLRTISLMVDNLRFLLRNKR